MHTNVGLSSEALEPIWARLFRPSSKRAAPRRETMRHRSGSAPARILEDSGGIVVEADVQGFGPEDIDIVLSERLLLIRAEAEESEERLVRHAPVEQSFDLPWGIDLPKVKAELRGHLLRVTLPRRS